MGKVEDILETVRRYAEAGKISAEEILRRFPELQESEDERIRKELIGHCKDLVRMNKDDKVMLSIYEPWLSWLEKQKEQKPGDEDRYMEGYMNGMNDALKGAKPAEWSEEDEGMRKAVWDEIEHQIEIMPDTDDMDSDDQDRYSELISMSVWMQDLPKCRKPHWKPSEEQMEALRRCILQVADEDYRKLVMLKNDLKKLM
jgi:hypothetical protein